MRFLGVSLLPDGLLINYWINYGVIYDIYRFRTYERFYEPKLGSVVFDVGAHVGAFSLRTSRRVGGKGLVVAIEPDPINYRLLVLNLKLNMITNVIPVRVALSDKNGVGLLFVADDPCEHSIISARSTKAIPVQVTTLGSLMKKLFQQSCKIDLVKIDAEGSELNVLRGICDLDDIIQRFVLAAYHAEDEAGGLASYLASQGYGATLYADPDGVAFVYATRSRSKQARRSQSTFRSIDRVYDNEAQAPLGPIMSIPEEHR